MHIDSVSNNGIKGQSFRRNLSPVTIITGKNFAGKTTTADCIRLALGGYLPGVGKKAGDMWESLVGSDSGKAECRVTFNTGLTASFGIEKTKKSCSTDINTPVAVALDSMLLDVRSFFGLSAAERVATVFRVAGGEKPDVTKLKQAINQIEAHPANVAVEIQADAIGSIDEVMAKPDWRTELQKVADNWYDEAKVLRSEHTKATGAFNGMTLPLNQPPVPGDVSALVKQRDELLALQGELRAILMRQQQTAGRSGRIEATKAKLEQAKAALAALSDPGPKPSFSGTQSELDEAMKASTLVAAEAQALSVELETTKLQLRRLEGVTICPTCGMHADLDKARAGFAERIQQIEAAEAKLNQKWDEAQALVEQLQEREENEAQKLNEWEAACQELSDAKALENNLTIELAGLEAAQATESQADTARIDELNKALAELPIVTSAIAEHQQKVQARSEFDALVKRRTAKSEEVGKLWCELEIKTAARKLLMASMQQWSEAAFGSLLATANRLTAGLLNSPLEFVDGDLGRRVDQKDHEQGMFASLGSWIPWRSFSGTEELIGMAAFGLALATKGSFRLLVLDEVGRLEQQRQLELINRVTEMVEEGAIDQAILMIAGNETYLHQSKLVTQIRV